MPREKPKLTTGLVSGKKRAHGGYSYLTTGKLPEHKKYIEQYLTAAREGLIHDLGPTEQDLTAAQIILIDRVITKLGVLRCIEEFARIEGVMKGDSLSPSLGKNYIGYDNSIRQSLVALGINKRASEKILDVQDVIREFDEDKARKEEEAE